MAVLLACLSGVLTALAFPPTDWSPLIWVALVPLLTAVMRADRVREAACLGAAAGLLFGLIVLAPLRSGHLWTGWAAISMADLESVRDAHARFLTALWIAASLWLAVFWALFTAAIKRISATRAEMFLVAGPLLWVLIPEYLRGLASSGFHWAILGNAAAAVPQIRQMAAVGGVWLISALVIAVNGAIAGFIVDQKSRRPRVACVMIIGCLMVALLYGQWRQQSIERTESRVGVVALQHGLDGNPSAEALATGLDRSVLAVVGATVRRLDGRFRILVLPESVTLGALSLDGTVARGRPSELQHRAVDWESIFAPVIDTRDITLILGTDTIEQGKIRNSMVAFGPNGIEGRYHKRRLVPFAEATPGWWPGSPRGELQYSPGADPRPITIEDLDLGAVICQEILFPSLVRDSVRAGATILVSGGNDGVFASRAVAETSARAAQLRAVESGRYLVRVMKTGVTGVIDPTGSEIARTDTDATTVLLAMVEPLDDLTLYARFGDWFVLLASVGSIAALLNAARREARTSQKNSTSSS